MTLQFLRQQTRFHRDASYVAAAQWDTKPTGFHGEAKISPNWTLRRTSPLWGDNYALENRYARIRRNSTIGKNENWPPGAGAGGLIEPVIVGDWLPKCEQ